MISTLNRFLKNKYFIIWLLVFIFILYFVFRFILNLKPDSLNIDDFTFSLYVFMLPMSFYDLNFIFSVIVDISYISIILYTVSNFIHYFFINSSSSTLTRVTRKKWINNIFITNVVYSILIVSIYFMLFIIFASINEMGILFLSKDFIVIIYKLLLTILIPNAYLLMFILTDSTILSLSFSSILYMFLEIIIKSTLNSIFVFKYVIPIILFILIIYVLIYFVSVNRFQRRDV